MTFRNTNDIKKIILLILLIIVILIAGILFVDWFGRSMGISVPLPGIDYLRTVSFKKRLSRVKTLIYSKGKSCPRKRSVLPSLTNRYKIMPRR